MLAFMIRIRIPCIDRSCLPYRMRRSWKVSGVSTLSPGRGLWTHRVRIGIRVSLPLELAWLRTHVSVSAPRKTKGGPLREDTWKTSWKSSSSRAVFPRLRCGPQNILKFDARQINISDFSSTLLTREFASFGEPELGPKWHQPHAGNCPTSCQKSRKPDFWYRSSTEKPKSGAGGSPEQVLDYFLSCIFATFASPSYHQNGTSPTQKTESAAHLAVPKTKFKHPSSLEKYGTRSGGVFLARIGAILGRENRKIRELELCTKVDQPRNEKMLQGIRKPRKSKV